MSQNRTYSINDKIRMDLPNGSYGIIQQVRQDGPFKEWPRYYIDFHYGLDVFGEQMTAASGLVTADRIIPVSDEEFLQATNKPYNTVAK